MRIGQNKKEPKGTGRCNVVSRMEAGERTSSQCMCHLGEMTVTGELGVEVCGAYGLSIHLQISDCSEN